jgi:hypothetical protein
MKKLTLQISFCCLLLPLTLHSKTQKLNQEVTQTKSSFNLNLEAISFIWQSAKHESIKGDSFSVFSTKTTINIRRGSLLEKEKTNYAPQILKYVLSKIMKKIKRHKHL